MVNTVENPFNNEDASEKYSKTDEIYLLSAKKATEFVNPAKENLDAVVADIGAGTGIGSEELIKLGVKDLTLIEPSAAMLEQAKARIGDRAEYIESKIEDVLDKTGKVFDYAYALNCFHLFEDLSKALANIACIIKDGGYFIFNISAPTYGFDEITPEEILVIEKNLEFYTKLSEKVDNPILTTTKELLQKTLDQNYDQVFTKKKVCDLFQAINFDVIEDSEALIKISSDYQVNIWSMMSSAFTQDQNLISEILNSIELPEEIVIRQAIFKMKNNNQ